MKKIFLWTLGIITLTVILVSFWIYSTVFSSVGPCGFDDGPFQAISVERAIKSDTVIIIAIENGTIEIDNRAKELSPLIFISTIEFKQIFEMDVSQTEGFENTRLSELTNITVEETNSEIKLDFFGKWTFGHEHGSMRINKRTGENQFCLSW